MALPIPLEPYGVADPDDLKAFRSLAKSFCEANFVGKVYVNAASGHAIEVPNSGIKHSIHNAHAPRIRALAVLPQAIEGAEFVGQVPDKMGRPDIVSVCKYEVEFLDADRALSAQIIAKEFRGQHGTTYFRFYDLSFLKL